jgi:hypothetical protein
VTALSAALHAQRILQHRAADDFRREIGHPGEGEPLALREGIADVAGAVVVQPNDVGPHNASSAGTRSAAMKVSALATRLAPLIVNELPPRGVDEAIESIESASR